MRRELRMIILSYSQGPSIPSVKLLGPGKHSNISTFVVVGVTVACDSFLQNTQDFRSHVEICITEVFRTSRASPTHR